MAHKEYSRIVELTSSTGTGDLLLDGAVSGYREFADHYANLDTAFVLVTGGADWELFTGTFTLSTNTLARTTMIASTNANAAVNWGIGDKTVRVVQPGWSDLTAAQLLALLSILGIVGGAVSVRAATTANITIATALNNGDPLDGVTLATGELVLVKDQSSTAENDIYEVGTSPARWTRFGAYDAHPGVIVTVQEGTTNADRSYLCTSNKGGTLGSTAITFVEIGLTAARILALLLTVDGAGSTLDADLLDGLSSAAFQPIDADLTTIAGLTATTDNFIQSKSSAWASRTPAQVLADLGAVGKFPFPSTQVPSAGANDLDDYEEGTFTPAFSFQTVGDSVITYTTQTGAYTKIGRQVFARFVLIFNTNAYTTAGGIAIVSALPFTAAADASGYGAAVTIGTMELVTMVASTIQVGGVVFPNSTTINFYAVRDNATDVLLSTTNFPASKTGIILILSVVYNV